MAKLYAQEVAIEFYRSINEVKVPIFLRDQLARAASSIVLNLAEGNAKPTLKDKRKFFYISYGSLKECEVIYKMQGLEHTNSFQLLDKAGALIWKLCKAIDSRI